MFREHCVISCGILYLELQHLTEIGFLNARQILFTPPGLHAKPSELEHQLVRRLEQLKTECPLNKTIVVYGKKCHIDTDQPARRVDTILQQYGPGIRRLEGDYGYDLLVSYEDRQGLSGDREGHTLWFTLGWLKSWKTIYQHYFGWDRADANANFPGFYDRIIVLDTLGVADQYMTEQPEVVLELFDWTGLEVEFHPITLDRLKGLLIDSLSEPAAVSAVPEQRESRF
jgi:hypothetical protein